MFRTQFVERVHRVGRRWAAQLAGVNGFAGTRAHDELEQGKAIRSGRRRALRLVRCLARRHPDQPRTRMRAPRRVGDRLVAAVDRIEGSAEDEQHQPGPGAASARCSAASTAT
jgi:hypothetical protein